MKYRKPMINLLLIIFSLFLLTSLTHAPSNKPDKQSIPTLAAKGDFNGDGILDSIWLKPPKIVPNENDCLGNCTSYIYFSDPHIPPIKVENCIGGMPTNLGDLDQNGSDEIGLSPQWFSSYWSVYHVWTYTKGKWKQAVPPFSTHKIQWDKGVKPIDADKNKAGYVIIWYSELTENDDIVIRSKSVKVLK